jgi:rhodanese-related sulfurtransferase
MLGGTAITAVVWPVLGGVTAAAPREGALLPDDLGLPLWSVVVAVTVMGVAATTLGRRIDSRGSARAWRITATETAALVLAVAFVVVDERTGLSHGRLAGIASEITREADHVEALDLAEWIRAGEPGLRIIDVREDLDAATYLIPGAEAVAIESLTTIRVAAGERVVLYSEGGAHAAQAWVLLRARGVANAFVLKDGLAAWEDEVLAPLRPAVADDTARARYSRARHLSIWFGGMPRLVPLPDEVRPTREPAGRRRRNTC